jgi:tungstate transport system permease protein
VTVKLVLDEFRTAIPLILHGNPYLMQIIGFTLQVAVVATAAAAVIGIPVGLAIGLGRFRGRRLVRVLANASLGVPPALVGAILFLLFAVQAPLGSLHLIFTRRAVFIAQTILALPYVVALTAAAIEGLPDGLLAQARSLGARRRQVAALALREARIGVMAAIIAALGTSLSEVAAIAIVGGNIYGRDQTLASATLYEVNTGDYPEALAIAIVLILLIVVVMGSLGVLQHRGDGVRWRFRSAT